MEILKYASGNHRVIIKQLVSALKEGQIIAYPTDTSYGLAVDATNTKALRRLYKIKERNLNQPTHVIPPNLAFVKKYLVWGAAASKLAKAFWPGPLTVILEFKPNSPGWLKKLGGNSYSLGIRFPDNLIAQDLAKRLGKPITTTSANPSGKISGGFDSYSSKDIATQFTQKKFKPDIILDSGKLPKRKPSTMLKLSKNSWEIIRRGPIKETQIKKILDNV